MKKTVSPTSSKPDQDTDVRIRMGVLKAIKYAGRVTQNGLHQRSVLIKSTQINSLNICQN
jgi:hypothetical protein